MAARLSSVGRGIQLLSGSPAKPVPLMHLLLKQPFPRTAYTIVIYGEHSIQVLPPGTLLLRVFLYTELPV